MATALRRESRIPCIKGPKGTSSVPTGYRIRTYRCGLVGIYSMTRIGERAAARPTAYAVNGRGVAMKSRLSEAAANRLAQYRTARTGPLAEAQKAFWEALLRGDIAEAIRQARIVEGIRGPQPPSPIALELIE